MHKGEERTRRLLKDGMFHRPYTSLLTEEQVRAIAKELGIKVETTAYACLESDIRCVFEVKP
jgi:PP-loop superfamily ATP-utilizing enzyme